MPDKNLLLKPLSSLEKVFADLEPTGDSWAKGSMMNNEIYSFQVAYFWTGAMQKNVQVQVHSSVSSQISIRRVGLVPSEMPVYADHDEHILRSAPGLYPDILLPLTSEGIPLLPGQWRALWVSVHPSAQVAAGLYPIEIVFCNTGGEELGRTFFEVEILNACLPKQKLLHTEWFHTDCLATYYGVDVFSEEHWRRIGQFVKTAVEHGINMILTPLFTPPLDTAIGGERPTVQLVDVTKSQTGYLFGFDKLKRWIDLCRLNGVEFFEFSHLFTQWGARHAPKIVAWDNGECRRIFGWETDAGGEEYSAFLNCFLPELLSFIRENGLENCSYFHVSDEPSMENLEDYKRASALIESYLKDFPVIDALSEYIFYETGAVRRPIPATNHIEPFLVHNVPDLWTYYCCGQYREVSNRFFCMPSARNRILGLQLYKYGIKGFLQWGYNFWYSQQSRFPVDPFRVTDADYAFPSGDAFVVYPGQDGPLVSLRLEVFYEALQDIRALELLEQYIGKEAVVAMLEEGLEQPITFKQYPRDAGWLLLKREQINRCIVKYSDASGIECK